MQCLQYSWKSTNISLTELRNLVMKRFRPLLIYLFIYLFETSSSIINQNTKTRPKQYTGSKNIIRKEGFILEEGLKMEF